MANEVARANHAMLCLRAVGGGVLSAGLLIAAGVMWETRGGEPGIRGLERATMFVVLSFLVAIFPVVWVRNARRAAGRGWGEEPWALTADLIATCGTLYACLAAAVALLMTVVVGFCMLFRIGGA